MSPEWQELLFASVEVINAGSLTGSGSRWGLSPWLPVLASSLQAALAIACSSAMYRHECQSGMWWHSTIPLGKRPGMEGECAKIRRKEEKKTLRIKGREKERGDEGLNPCFSYSDDSLYYTKSHSGLWLHKGCKRETTTVITLSLSHTVEDMRLSGR